MHFQYLVEDQSGAALIRILMQKIVELYPNATYDCKGRLSQSLCKPPAWCRIEAPYRRF